MGRTNRTYRSNGSNGSKGSKVLNKARISTQDTDVLVVGAGVVGLATALAARRAGCAVQVLERAQAPAVAMLGPSVRSEREALGPATSRVYALAPASVALLQTLDAWPVGAPWFSPGPVCAMAVYERASRGEIALSTRTARDSASQADAQMASIVGHDPLIRALTEACARTGVPIAWDHTITDVTPAGDGARVVTDDGTQWFGRLVCAADGARSTMRELLGVSIDGASYSQSGVTAVLRLSAPHESVARQHFCAGEVLALLPLADPHDVVLVWSARSAHAETLLELPESAFLSRLNAALALPGIEAVSATDRLSFPLRWLRAERMVCGRVALLGDAAHVMHPLAGQGLNLGLGDVAEFADTVLPALAAPGLGRVLGRFERSRKAEAVLYRGAVDSLFRLFNAKGLRALRGAGLNLVDHLPLLKRMIMARASGRRIASLEPSNG